MDCLAPIRGLDLDLDEDFPVQYRNATVLAPIPFHFTSHNTTQHNKAQHNASQYQPSTEDGRMQLMGQLLLLLRSARYRKNEKNVCGSAEELSLGLGTIAVSWRLWKRTLSSNSNKSKNKPPEDKDADRPDGGEEAEEDADRLEEEDVDRLEEEDADRLEEEDADRLEEEDADRLEEEDEDRLEEEDADEDED
eukprot:jgi/Psemu1/46541/gm1.46541_g